MADIDTPGRGKFGSQEHCKMAGFMKGFMNSHCYLQIIKALCFVVSEKNFLVFPIVILWGLMSHRAGPFLIPGHDWQNLCRVPINNVTC